MGDIHSLVERYFNDELNDEETENLFSIIRKDAEAEQVYNEYLLAMEAIRLAGRRDLKTDLKEAAAKQDAHQGKKTTQILIILAAVLAVVLIFLMFLKSNGAKQSQQMMPERDSTSQSVEGIDIARERQDTSDMIPVNGTQDEAENDALAQNDNPSVNHDAIFDRFYAPFRDESIEGNTRGTENEDPALSFQSLYWNRKYSEATVIFEKHLISNSNNDNLLFQYAICLLETKRFREAEKILNGLLERNESRFEDEVFYYLILTRIKNQKIDAAQKLISKVNENKNSKYYEKYIEILKELNQ